MSSAVAAATAPSALARFLDGFDEVLYFPTIPWAFAWQRQQVVIASFAAAHPDRRGWMVPPLGLVAHSPLRAATWAAAGRKLAARAGRRGACCASRDPAYALPENVTTVEVRRVPGAGPWRGRATLALSPKLRQLLRKSGRRLVVAMYVNDVVKAFLDRAEFAVLDLSERRQASRLLSPYAKALERAAAARADVLVADSRATLADYGAERAAAGRPGHYLPQGFTPTGRRRAASTAPDAPLAYLGNLHHALDVAWLTRLAAAHPGRKLRLCGEVLDERTRALLRLPTVEYWGPIAHRDVSRFLEDVGWGVVPYVVADWTAGVFPTKLLEYLDCGVPVLSTALPEVAQFAHLPFVHVLPDAAAPLPAASMAGADAFLAGHTWRARMQRYGDLLLEARR